MQVRRHSNLWYVEDAEYIPEVVAAEAPAALERALAAGAVEPVRYLGVGMTGFVFCDAKNMAFKVGRRPESEVNRRMLSDEAEWLETATRVPWVREHVAHIDHFDAEHVVIVRECVIGKIGTWGKSNLIDIHRELEKHMLPYGWTAPEFKEDSYVIARGRGGVLVDASMPHRVGRRLVEYVLDALTGKRQVGRDRIQDFAYQVREEVRQGTVPPAIGQRVEAKIKEYVESTA